MDTRNKNKKKMQLLYFKNKFSVGFPLRINNNHSLMDVYSHAKLQIVESCSSARQ